MAKKNIFDDDLEQSEYELLSEDISRNDSVQDILDEYEEDEEDIVEPAPVKQHNVKSLNKSVAYTLNSQESSIMNLAMVQLEQAKLYDMFLKHNLFEGVKANPTALKKVEAELKGFILERMQILLGMKEDNKKTSQVKVELPFNDVEVDFLKALAFKGTKGESANQKLKPAEARTVKQEESQGLRKLVDVIEEPSEDEVEEIQVPLIRKTPRVIERTQKPPVRKSVSKPSTIEEIAREDIKRMAKRKPINQMSPEELAEANKKISSARSAKPASALPMPDESQMVTHYMAQQLQKSNNPNSNSVLMQMLGNKLGFSTNTVQQIGDDHDD